MTEQDSGMPKELISQQIANMLAAPIEPTHEREWRDSDGREERYLLRTGPLNTLFGWASMGLKGYCGNIISTEDINQFLNDIKDILEYRKTEDNQICKAKDGDRLVGQVQLVISYAQLVQMAINGEHEQLAQKVQEVKNKIQEIYQQIE